MGNAPSDLVARSDNKTIATFYGGYTLGTVGTAWALDKLGTPSYISLAGGVIVGSTIAALAYYSSEGLSDNPLLSMASGVFDTMLKPQVPIAIFSVSALTQYSGIAQNYGGLLTASATGPIAYGLYIALTDKKQMAPLTRSGASNPFRLFQ